MNTETQSHQDHPAVIALSGGGFVITWESNYGVWGTDSQEGIFGQIYAADGTPVGTEFHVNSTTAGRQSEPELIALDDGGFAALWHDAAPGNDSVFQLQRYNADGTPNGNEETLTIDALFGDVLNNWQTTGLEDGDLAALSRKPATGELYV